MHRNRTPRVSICVPSLNTRAFLPERFDSIFEQTFADWELLVYDSYSEDGSWEYIARLAAQEPRIRAWQGPREGTPGSWTPCVRQASGEYVYVATSDDTMPSDCLEKLVGALDAHPDCAVAHCPLRAIDEQGSDVPAVNRWWQHEAIFALSSGSLLDTPHIRQAPFDGLLHMLGGSVYISITQLLIRRTLFDRVGYFQRTWGSVGDFNWCMRVGLATNAVHVPDTWGGWRVHAEQATAAVSWTSAHHARQVDDMIANALEACGPLLRPELRIRLGALEHEAADMRAYIREVSSRSTRPLTWRGILLAWDALARVPGARQYVRDRLVGTTAADWVQHRLSAAGVPPALTPVAHSAASRT
jgi:GT2 family glycosyltransferase